MKFTEEQIGMAFAEATGCGMGSYDKDGKWCRILCDDKEKGGEHDTCDCRKGAKAILALITSAE